MVDGRDLSLSLREKRNREAHRRPTILQNTYVHSNALFEEMTHKERHMLNLISFVENSYLRCSYNNAVKDKMV